MRGFWRSSFYADWREPTHSKVALRNPRHKVQRASEWNNIEETTLWDRLQGQLCRRILLGRCLPKPTRTDLLIDRHSITLPIAQTEVVLGSGIALNCRRSNPLSRFHAVLRHQMTNFIGHSQ